VHCLPEFLLVPPQCFGPFSSGTVRDECGGQRATSGHPSQAGVAQGDAAGNPCAQDAFSILDSFAVETLHPCSFWFKNPPSGFLAKESF